MAANMYRVGDYVYFETSATSPYQIRRIEELTKTPTGNVEAKVMCFYRRRDISNTLVNLADKHQNYADETDEEGSPVGAGAAGDSVPTAAPSSEKAQADGEAAGSGGAGALSDSQRHQLKHRELFLSRQVETLPATTIRGKCSVTLLNDTESLLSYLNREDVFYYTLVYDSSQKTLLADRGEIRVGGRYQAEVQPLLASGESDGRDVAQLEEAVWRPDQGLAPTDLDRYLLISRAVGTMARAMDACSAVRQPTLGLAAASASRDATVAHAYRTLHANGYDLGRAFCALVTESGPVLCRDELEEWSPGECNLFEEAMDKYGKDFHDIRQDFLPWKSMKAIVEYFYMWKTTDRYVQQKRLKAAEAERKLKQVYIPNYTKPNPAVLYNRQDVGGTSRGCESCYAATSGGQWYVWGPPHLSCRLCSACWAYWKRYGGLKSVTRLEKAIVANPGIAGAAIGAAAASAAGAAAAAAAAGSGVHRCTVSGCDKEFRLRPQLVRHLASAHSLDEASLGHLSKAKAVKSMLMSANLTTRLARRLCSDLLRLRRLARRPFDARFDARRALHELPKRYQAATVASGVGAKQLLSSGKGNPKLPKSLTVEQLNALLAKICPAAAAASEADGPCDLLSRERPSALAPSPRPRSFPPPDAARRAEFHRQLDEQRLAQPQPPQQPPHQAANSNGSSSLGGLSLLPQKRPAPSASGQNGDAASAAKRPALKAAAAAKYVQQQQQQLQQQNSVSASNPVANSNGASAHSTPGSGSASASGAGAAAAAAEEIFLFGTKRLRTHLSTGQLRKAGRRPFKLVPTAGAPTANGGGSTKANTPTANVMVNLVDVKSN